MKISEKIRRDYGTVSHYAAKKGLPLREVYRVLAGYSGKLESPKTISGRIVAQLKKDGYWHPKPPPSPKRPPSLNRQPNKPWVSPPGEQEHGESSPFLNTRGRKAPSPSRRQK